ncbi:FK506-binding protein 1 [Fulvia fulva]|uniref:peptidylprolyl isomerase n=1 Tax=Passalora fulva TaxID=5499 RepID=A0A9Q8P833_PASFU|nr:FK506-binding protein 1 [Fulvia fulva]KAK4615379.1 FK506-binding protein 1 [Fulvia fulva]KAK4616658.1 FK506-binding protein 1 [Fulvia fulva]UJO16663.1 FK506-binding protein 1 [Fulvia fulva]WPV19625.1 FK506-binding protein 1 [Fulvia fulva]WPV34658.1 FK506-binding protein 1 [Fulvia fulva]
MFKTTTRLFKPNAIRNFTTTPSRPFHFSAANMGVTKQKLQDGDGKTYAKAGDNITMEYTGTLFDENAPNKKGKQFDSSVGRGDFDTRIGVGQVIKGWDEGVLSTDGGMSLGEKATLTITGDYAYGSSGFPGLIPANATLVFDVQLKAINGNRAPGL